MPGDFFKNGIDVLHHSFHFFSFAPGFFPAAACLPLLPSIKKAVASVVPTQIQPCKECSAQMRDMGDVVVAGDEHEFNGSDNEHGVFGGHGEEKEQQDLTRRKEAGKSKHHGEDGSGGADDDGIVSRDGVKQQRAESGKDSGKDVKSRPFAAQPECRTSTKSAC